MSTERFARFADFYPFYLREHSNTICRRLHFIGSTLVLVCLWQLFRTGALAWLGYGLLCGYGFAWVGHFFFEKNKPATFTHPFYSFAGDWVLTSISPQRQGYDQFWFGTEARVTQTDTTLVITRVSPPPLREARFTLGAESQNEYVVNGQKLVRDSRATLSRDTLLISTDTTPADGQRWLSNILRWSLDPDGTLIVGDTEICGKGECPSVVTTLKFKRK